MHTLTSALGRAGQRRLLIGGVPLLALLTLLVWLQTQHEAKPLVEAGLGAAVAVSFCYLVWYLDPAWTVALGVFLSPIAGFWQQLHVPGQLSPNRLLLVGAFIALVLRAPAARNRPPLHERPVHWLLGFASLYILGSAAAAGTLFQKDPFFGMFEAYGFLLFALFYVAPAIFRDERRRRILIGTLAFLGAYLGLTALFEAVHANALVWPRYILDPNVGIHYGRARGPFAEAVQNGIGLYTCAIGAVLGALLFRRRFVRVACILIAILDAAGILFTLQRSVWLGAVVATIVTFLAFKDLRRYAVVVLLAGALVGGTAYAIVGSKVIHKRATDQQTVWDRDNLNRAALNMIEARPLQGFGYATFPTKSVTGEFFHQNFNYPLSAAGLGVHNEFLSYGAELGLVGLTIWLAGLLLAAYTALRSPTRTREERFWKQGFFAYLIFYLIVSSFVPPALFPNLIFWLFAGVVGSRFLLTAPAVAPAPSRAPSGVPPLAPGRTLVGGWRGAGASLAQCAAAASSRARMLASRASRLSWPAPAGSPTRARPIMAALMATCGGLAALYGCFAIFGAVRVPTIFDSGLAVGLAAVWFLGFLHRARMQPNPGQRRDRERRGF